MLQKNIIWLVGKSEEIDVFWNYSKFAILKNLNELNFNSLFEQKNYKYVFSKNDDKFFENFELTDSLLLVKGKEKKEKFMHNSLLFDSFSIPELFECFISFFQINFSKEASDFVFSNCKTLNELICINLLSEIGIEKKSWSYFLTQTEDQNWFALQKNNELIPLCIQNEALTIPILNFCNRFNSKKQFLTLLLLANIKSGEKLWTFDGIWKKLI